VLGFFVDWIQLRGKRQALIKNKIRKSNRTDSRLRAINLSSRKGIMGRSARNGVPRQPDEVIRRKLCRTHFTTSQWCFYEESIDDLTPYAMEGLGQQGQQHRYKGRYGQTYGQHVRVVLTTLCWQVST
jgi:hypothetical protein